MKYFQICPNCKFMSEPDEEICPNCGLPKPEDKEDEGIINYLVETVSSRITFIDNPEVFVRLIFRIIIFLAGILLIPGFVRESEIFIVALYLYTIIGLTKALEEKIKSLKGIHYLTKLLITAYAGGGIANLISYAGKYTGYKIGYYFNPVFLWNEISNKSFLIPFGIIAGVGVFVLTNSLIKEVVD